MTDYYGAFSTSTSNFPGHIQSTIIDTSYESILTCLYNNQKASAFYSSFFPQIDGDVTVLDEGCARETF